MEKSTNSLKTLRNLALFILVVIIYAYGLQVTKVDLEEPQKPRRQEQLTNILRALAQPDLFEYDTERIVVNAPILIPCANTPPAAPTATEGPILTLSTNCAEPGSEITVSGSNFPPNDTVFIFFVPYVNNPEDEVELRLANNAVEIDENGDFAEIVTLRKDRISERTQTIRAVVNQRSGLPRPSEALLETRDKIIETVFLALIATTLGVFIAVPISFLAARNLMLDVTSTFLTFMGSLVAMPVGAYLGYLLFNYLTITGQRLVGGNPQASDEAWLWLMLPLIGFASLQVSEANNSEGLIATLRRITIAIVLVIVLVVGGGAIGQLVRGGGVSLEASLDSFTFVGNFLVIFGDSILLGLPALGALVGLTSLSSITGTLIENFSINAAAGLKKGVSVVLAVVAGAIVFAFLAAIINWFYELGEPLQIMRIPAIIGAIVFGGMAVAFSPDKTIPTGMYTYYLFRTIMNIFRSIEPLVMVVAFAVWVGIGPFAGVMALGLHTIVALGKLYSEQVENIAEGPIEAITATGANRLQTIIYAVIPQIVPPYIAFTLYRWDINVRMSTIIGFGGGGGIGFLLSQNINLLKYRQASVNMIAIAVVVATLDYVSAKVREKIT